MSRRNWRLIGAGVGAAAVLAIAALLALRAAGPRRAPAPDLTFALGMRKYMFFMASDTTYGNPTILVDSGSRARFVLTNDEDTHVLHNFGIPALGVPCGPPMEPGERREVIVAMPRSGTYAYTCCTHPGMGGKIVIREGGRPAPGRR